VFVLFLIFASLALVILPIGYARLCHTMRKQGVERPPVISFFLSFGTLGGLCVMFALSPSPVGLICFLPVFLSSMLSFFASIKLSIQGEDDWYHKMAIGTGFLASIPFVIVVGIITFGLLGHAAR
jgi:hypothetical protein